MMAAIGTGNIEPGIITMSLGSSGTVYAFDPQPQARPEASVANFCSSTDGWLPLICTLNLTNVTGAVRELFGLSVEGFNQMARQAPAGAEGVSLLPFLNGERVPGLPDATGNFQGLTLTNMTQANLCRAAIEGTTYGLRYGLDLLRRNGLQSHVIRLVGGGSKSPLWRQLVADIMATPVVCPEQSEAAALGAAIQAAWCVAADSPTLADLCRRCVRLDPAGETRPEADNVRAYEHFYQRYRLQVAALTE